MLRQLFEGDLTSVEVDQFSGCEDPLVRAEDQVIYWTGMGSYRNVDDVGRLVEVNEDR